MNTEILVRGALVYVIGFYVTTFVMSMLYERRNMEFGDSADWFACVCWPISILMLIVIGFMAGIFMLCDWLFLKLKSKFPVMARFIQGMLKCVRTVIFVISLLFRPAKFGEIVGKHIFLGSYFNNAIAKDHCD